MQDIVAAQTDGRDLRLRRRRATPTSSPSSSASCVFLIATQAELTQPPFDMPVAESEIVTGYMTEYSGLRFLLFFIAEFATAGAFAARDRHPVPGRLVPLRRPRPRRQLHERGRPARRLRQDDAWSASSSTGCGSRYPRFREDQLQAFAWTFLIPVSLVNILVTAIAEGALF